MNLDAFEKKIKKMQHPEFIQLDAASVVRDIPKFIDSHMAIIRSDSPEKIKEPFKNRLRIAYKAIQEFNASE